VRVRIVDLDGAVTDQGFHRAPSRSEPADIVPAGDLAPRLRIVAARDALRELGNRIGPRPADEPELIFYGSGDFHHVADLFLARVEKPVTVIQFDNHPDWVTFPATSNCGGWVNRALERRNVRRVITIGPTSTDLVLPQMKSANLDAIRDGRLEMYAWRVPSTRLLGAAVDSPGSTTSGDGFAKQLVWRNLADEDWEAFVEDLIARLGPEAIWITFDKDVLATDEAVTNWDQGAMRLDQVLYAIERLAEKRRVLGVDVCGDYSPPLFRDPFRYTLAKLDHPRQPKFDAAMAAVNDAANARIVNSLEQVLAC
jgi:arginase family enzyme